MVKRPGRRGRVTRDQWLMAALEALFESGPEAVNIQALARQLKVAKTSFYWHFNDRSELIDSMAEYWIHELTEVVTRNPDIRDQPARERLIKAAEIIEEYDLSQYDMAFRWWAKREPRAREALIKANELRKEFVESAFAELGFEDQELAMRTALFVCYQTAEKFVFPELSKSERQQLRQIRLDLILSSAQL